MHVCMYARAYARVLLSARLYARSRGTAQRISPMWSLLLHRMQLSHFGEVRITPARGTVTITAQSELQYAPLAALLLSLYLIFEAEALSHTWCIRLTWGCLGPFVSVFRFGIFISRFSRAGEARVNDTDLSSAVLFGTIVVIGTWAVDFFAPPSFPPPLFEHPLGLSVRRMKLFSTTITPSLCGVVSSLIACLSCTGRCVRRVRCVAGPWQSAVCNPGDQHNGVWSSLWIPAVRRRDCSRARFPGPIDSTYGAAVRCDLCS